MTTRYGAGIHNVLDEKHRHECAYSTCIAEISLFQSKETRYYHEKVTIKLDDMERRILVKLLYEKRNELIREGRFTDGIDELILKIIDAKRADMENISEQMNAYITAHPFDPGNSDCETEPDQLYQAYAESHESEPWKAATALRNWMTFYATHLRKMTRIVQGPLGIPEVGDVFFSVSDVCDQVVIPLYKSFCLQRIDIRIKHRIPA